MNSEPWKERLLEGGVHNQMMDLSSRMWVSERKIDASSSGSALFICKYSPDTECLLSAWSNARNYNGGASAADENAVFKISSFRWEKKPQIAYHMLSLPNMKRQTRALPLANFLFSLPISVEEDLTWGTDTNASCLSLKICLGKNQGSME